MVQHAGYYVATSQLLQLDDERSLQTYPLPQSATLDQLIFNLKTHF